MKRVFFFAVTVCLVAANASGHVGSPDVFYEGVAGPYRLLVTVRIPQMIPGVAQIEAQVLDGSVSGIQIVPLRVVGEGSETAPPSDRMERSAAEAQFFTGKLWLMESGAFQVRMDIDGQQGKAKLSVPVAAFAQRTLRMQKTTGALLAVLMTFLGLSLISIIGAAVRESQLAPGQEVPPKKRFGARAAMAGAALTVLAVLFLGNMWWNSVASANARDMVYKPPPIHASITGANVIAEGRPTVPAGAYAVFADIVRESGFPDMMTTQVMVPKALTEGDGKPLLGDDSETEATSVSSSEPRTTAPLSGGGHVEWIASGLAIHALRPALLRFRIVEKTGHPAADLEPYMGMAGHLVILRRDLSVFAHVHPAGSVPMAALALLEEASDGNMNSMPGMLAKGSPTEITFPYGFPQPGDYRLFLQVKRSGRVETAVFDTHVVP